MIRPTQWDWFCENCGCRCGMTYSSEAEAEEAHRAEFGDGPTRCENCGNQNA